MKQDILDLLKLSTSTDTILEWMTRNGSSLILDWGEDDSLWECSWITGGVRYTAFEKTAKQGLRVCLAKVAQMKLGLDVRAF